jgi:hypothetical protein
MSKHMDHELGRPIAERALICGTRRKKQLTVRLGAPKRAEQVDWVCPYQIVGLGSSRVDAAYGVDALQALMMALEGIRVRIEKAGACTWVGGENGDAGFPRLVPTYFGAAFATHINQQIDRELERFGKVVRSTGRKAPRSGKPQGARLANRR